MVLYNAPLPTSISSILLYRCTVNKDKPAMLLYDRNFYKSRGFDILLTGKYCIRKYDRKLAIRYEKEFKARIKRLKLHFDDLRKEYIEAHKELTSFTFWEKYLELDDAHRGI